MSENLAPTPDKRRPSLAEWEAAMNRRNRGVETSADAEMLDHGLFPLEMEADFEAEADDDAAAAVARRPLRSMLTGAFERLEARATGKEKPIALPWGQLNNLLGGGLWPGLHVLIGNTGSYKTQFALQAALSAAEQGVPVLYVGLELGDVDVVARLVGLRAGLKWSDLFLGKDEKALQAAHAEHAEALSKLPFYVELGPPRGWHYNSLLAAAAAIREQYPKRRGTPEKPAVPMLVVLDFLQLVTGSPGEDARNIIGSAAYAGRGIARQHDAAVLMISSTSRANYEQLAGEGFGKGSPTRLVGMGKESGEIEYAADSLSVLGRMPWPDGKDGQPEQPEDGTTVWLGVAKGRAVLPGWAEFRFDGGRFREPSAEDHKARQHREHAAAVKAAKAQPKNAESNTAIPSRAWGND